MNSLLLIEDEDEKASAITRVIDEVPRLPYDDITRVKSSAAALAAMASRAFDVVILDLAIPVRDDAEPLPDEGLRLLDRLQVHASHISQPGHVIGLTQHDDLYWKASEYFESRRLTLLRYRSQELTWQTILRARLFELSADAAQRASAPTQCFAVVLCALPEVELTAMLAQPLGWQQRPLPGDHTLCWEGTIDRLGGKERVVVAALPRMGMPAAAVVGTKLAVRLKPKILAMCGIAAGWRERVGIGDPVAADPSWDWGSGKWSTTSEGGKFEAAPYMLNLAPVLREQVRSLSMEASFFKSLRANWKEAAPEEAPRLHVGPMASGAAVLADGVAIRSVAEQQRQLLAVDMEAYGVFAAAEELPNPAPLGLAIKSVADFADGAKNDVFQPYAAYTSAATVIEVLRRTAVAW